MIFCLIWYWGSSKKEWVWASYRMLRPLDAEGNSSKKVRFVMKELVWLLLNYFFIIWGACNLYLRCKLPLNSLLADFLLYSGTFRYFRWFLAVFLWVLYFRSLLVIFCWSISRFKFIVYDFSRSIPLIFVLLFILSLLFSPFFPWFPWFPWLKYWNEHFKAKYKSIIHVLSKILYMFS